MMRKINLVLAIFTGLTLVIGLAFYFQFSTGLAQAPADPSQVIENGLAYLRAQQQADGGITGFSGVSDPDTTARGALAFIAGDQSIKQVTSSAGHTIMDYLVTQAITFTHDATGTLFPGRAGLLLTAVVLGGEEPLDFGGMDLAAELGSSFRAETGAYSTAAQQDFSSGAASDLNQAWSLLGLSLAGSDIPAAAIEYLAQSQAVDGSWGMGDPDTTALVATALLASRQVDAQSTAIQNAVKFFHDTQLDNAGWKPSWDTDPLNADSTGWILQALVSAGEDPTGENWRKQGLNPIQALMGLQKVDGSIGGTYANPYSTAEAILGLAQKPLVNLGKTPVIHRVGLAVFSGDDSLFTTCITFTENSLSGLELLQRSGLSIETATNPNQGTAVCKIGEVGDPSDSCFGSMPDYWSYWQLGSEGWQYAVTGAEQSQVMDGDVNAWSWGVGNPPAVLTFENICEGVAFVLPTTTPTTLPPTQAPQPTEPAATLPGEVPSQPALTPAERSTTGVGMYVVYVSIIVVLVALIVIVIQRRKR